MDRSLSAIIAVRNAQCSLRAVVIETLDVMSELTSRMEMVIVDDCSTDATIEISDELAAIYPQLFAIRHPVPQGYAAAIRTGIDRCLGEVVYFADEDCHMPLNGVCHLWAALEEYELVLGYPAELGAAAAVRGIGCTAGGYQMGYRRVVRGLGDVLGQRPALLARLRECGVSWREIGIAGGVPPRRLGSLGLVDSIAEGRTTTLAGRSVRTDLAETEPGKPKQPNFETLDAKNSRPRRRYLYSPEKLVE